MIRGRRVPGSGNNLPEGSGYVWRGTRRDGAPGARPAPPALGAVIQAARKEQGLNQGALARLADISQSHLSSIEGGRDQPSSGASPVPWA